MSAIVRRPAMGFEAPPVVAPTEVLERTSADAAWRPVVVAEEKSGFVVRDRRKVK